MRAIHPTRWSLVHLLLFILVSHALMAQVSLPPASEGLSRFQRTVRYLQEATPQLRAEFAGIALTGLASAYFEEAQLARANARAGGQDAALRGWSFAVDHYARQMPLLLGDIELGFPVAITVDRQQSVGVTVGGRTVILSHPRMNQQMAFEQEILASFCSSVGCEQFMTGESEAGPIPVSAVQVQPQWLFTEEGPTCSYQGITVRFKNGQNLANSRLICQQFLQEVMLVSDEFAWQQRHGVTIQWDELDIQSTPHRPEHVVRLNKAGDTVLVTAPLLYASSRLFEQMIPWIRQRLGHEGEARVELNADLYSWQQP